jgi:hypothetical protein
LEFGRQRYGLLKSDDWIQTAVKEITFAPCLGHYGSLEEMAGSFSCDAVDWNDNKLGEIIDTLAALRSGEKRDALKLHPQRPYTAK